MTEFDLTDDDAQRDETDDTEGHSFRGKVADAERDETEDVQGHADRFGR